MLALLATLSLTSTSLFADVLTFNAPATARENRMTLRVDATRLVLTDDGSRVLASTDAATTRRVVIHGADGATDDTLTVDLTGITLPQGIDYDGGRGGFDTLVIRGTSSHAAQTATQLSPHDGVIDFGALQIRYFGLEPITDTTPSATFTINATAGGEEINVVDGAPGTTQVNSGGSGTFESIDFANKTNVTINGVGGTDIFTVNNPNPATGLTTMTFNGTSATDTFRITPSATVRYTVTGGDPVPPGTGDTLIVSLAGTTGLTYSLASDATGLQGSFNFTNRQPVIFSQVETINPSDMFITKAGPATANAGSIATYTITILNNGANDAANVALTDVVPAGSTFVSIAAPAGTSCTTPAVGGTGTVSCMTPVLLAGDSAIFTLQLRLNSSLAPGTVVTNTASVTTGTSELNGADNSASRPTTTTVAADVGITKTGPASAPPSTNGTYTITLTNFGPSDAQTVQMTDVLPAGTTFVSLSAPAGFSCTTPAVGGTGTITCSIATFAPSTPAVFTLVLAYGPTAGATITNTATVTAAFDINGMNDLATATTTITAVAADLAITKTGPAGSVTAGSNITYTIGVTNNGPDAASTVTITDILPAGTTFVSATPTQGTCSATTIVTCSAGALASGASMTVTLVITAPPAGASVSNTASVSNLESDPVVANNVATATTTLVPASADLAITKTTPATTVAPGANITYTIGVTNNGPNAASNVTITDVLPAGSSFVSATPTQGTCSGTATVTCSAGALASGASMSVTLVIAAPATGTAVSNTATVTATEADAVPANNSATSNVTLTATTAIPTMSEWALILMAALLGLIAVAKLK